MNLIYHLPCIYDILYLTKNIEFLTFAKYNEVIVLFDEGIASRDGEHLNIQCLIQEHDISESLGTARKYHYHKYIEIIYMLEGDMHMYINDEIYRVTDGDLALIYPYEPHAFRCLKHDKYIVIKMLPEILITSEQRYNEFEYIFNMRTVSKNRCRVISKIPEIGNLVIDAYNKFNENDYCYELFVRADVIKICAHILSLWQKQGVISPISNSISKNNLSIINNLMNHIKNNSMVSLKTHEAAGMCNMSDGYFSRIFKHATNMTFTEYIKSVKLGEAERLLKCSNESVTDISQILNYATTSHFIEDFRKAKGISPKKYRKSNE